MNLLGVYKTNNLQYAKESKYHKAGPGDISAIMVTFFLKMKKFIRHHNMWNTKKVSNSLIILVLYPPPISYDREVPRYKNEQWHMKQIYEIVNSQI